MHMKINGFDSLGGGDDSAGVPIHMDNPFPPVGFKDAVGDDSGGSYDSSKSSRLPLSSMSRCLFPVD